MHRVGRRLYLRVRDNLPQPLRSRLDSGMASLSQSPMPLRLAAATARRRLGRDRLAVGWILSRDEDSGTTRAQGLQPHAFLRTSGVHSVILAKRQQTFRMRPGEMARIVRARFDVVVFENVHGHAAEGLARALRAAATGTVYAVGDPVRTTMSEVVDRVILVSETMRDISGGPQTSVIEPAIESPPGACKDYSRSRPGARIRVVWVGYPENLHLLAPVREALRDPLLAGFELITISRGPGVTFQWDRKQVWDQLLQCDIAVLPSDQTEWYQAKPNTRMTMLKALGLPIVASPIPSYVATLTQGAGCYFARDIGDWVDCLAALTDLEKRREMGLAEREEVLASHGSETIGRQWLELLERLAEGRGARSRHMAAST